MYRTTISSGSVAALARPYWERDGWSGLQHLQVFIRALFIFGVSAIIVAICRRNGIPRFLMSSLPADPFFVVGFRRFLRPCRALPWRRHFADDTSSTTVQIRITIFICSYPHNNSPRISHFLVTKTPARSAGNLRRCPPAFPSMSHGETLVPKVMTLVPPRCAVHPKRGL